MRTDWFADRVRFSSGLHLNFSLISIITAGFIFGIYDGYLSTPLLLGWSIGLIINGGFAGNGFVYRLSVL